MSDFAASTARARHGVKRWRPSPIRHALRRHARHALANAAPTNGRCRNHGGLCTGPKTQAGKSKIAAAQRCAGNSGVFSAAATFRPRLMVLATVLGSMSRGSIGWRAGTTQRPHKGWWCEMRGPRRYPTYDYLSSLTGWSRPPMQVAFRTARGAAPHGILYSLSEGSQSTNSVSF
jgi:hypothetical protein